MNGQVFSALIEGGGKVMTTTLPHLIAPLHRQLPVESQLSHKFIRWKGSKMLYHWLFTTLPSPQPKILPFFNKSSQQKIYFLEKKKKSFTQLAIFYGIGMLISSLLVMGFSLGSSTLAHRTEEMREKPLVVVGILAQNLLTNWPSPFTVNPSRTRNM